VLLLNVDKGTAPEVWQRLRDAYSETGLWPFLADADQDKDYHQPTVWDHLEEGSRQDQTPAPRRSSALFDGLELFVANPPTERAEVEAMARAQYNYCVDIVDQGVETLAALAEEQVHSHRWYFWWD